jgi:hypothetical protein
VRVLLRGLKFCPTPQNLPIEQNTKYMDNYCRRLRLQEFFVGKELPNKSWFHKKSTFEPYSGRNKMLDTSIDFLKEMLEMNKKHINNTKFNISLWEKTAMQALMDNENIVIKEADKGSAVVLMDKIYYKDKLLEQLTDNNTYEKISKNMDRNIINKIKKLSEKYKSILTKD